MVQEKEAERTFVAAMQPGYHEMLEGDRDEAVMMIAKRLTWFGEDCRLTAERITDNPRAAISLVLVLSSMMQDLDRMSGIVQALQASKHNATTWDTAREGTTAVEA